MLFHELFRVNNWKFVQLAIWISLAETANLVETISKRFSLQTAAEQSIWDSIAPAMATFYKAFAREPKSGAKQADADEYHHVIPEKCVTMRQSPRSWIMMWPRAPRLAVS